MSPRERAGALLGFGLLAAYAALHWFALIADPPLWRCAGCVAIALATAVLLGELGRIPGRRRTVAALFVVLASIAAGMLVLGVPARFLPPGGWDDLLRELDAGLSGVSQVELPYAEGGTWTRLGILFATPLTLALAAALAFWPSPGRRGPAPWCGARAPGRSLRGVGYLGVAQLGAAPRPGAPGLYRRIPVARAAARLAGRGGGRHGRGRRDGGAARCRAGRLDRAADQVRELEIFGDEEVASFDWDHSYGPLDWPQNGTELFEVEGAERPFYWKTDVLDDFDGFAWTRGGGLVGSVAEAEALAKGLAGATTEMVANEGQWVEGFEVTIQGLRSNELVSTGTTLAAEDVQVLPTAPDGTTAVLGEPLTHGSSYRITAYTPDPSARLLRRRDDLRYPRALDRYTSLLLPGADPTGLPAAVAPASPLVGVTVPLRTGRERESGLISYGAPLPESGPYAHVRALAERITRDAPATTRPSPRSSATCSRTTCTTRTSPIATILCPTSCSGTSAATASTSPARWR